MSSRFSWLPLAAVLGCGDGDPIAADAGPSQLTGELSYVGEVTGTDIRVGLATRDAKTDLFFCGGPTTLARTQWYRGIPFPSPQPAEKGGATATIEASANEAHGTVVFADGESHAWTAARVDSAGLAGLYDVKDETGVGGVVVFASDAAQGAFLFKDVAAPVQQIIVVRPIEPTNRGIAIQVDTRTLFASRVRPAPER